MEYRKVHSAPKRVVPQGDELNRVVGQTMATIAQIVGATLGPGGRQVLIESQDDRPPKATKDGVTVFKALGFVDPLAQAVNEAVREAAVRTANQAGDGTTTATILAEAIYRATIAYVTAHPGYSPQRLVRELSALVEHRVIPFLRDAARRVSMNTEEDRAILRRVALISANGDDELAAAVMRCYDICGDEGNVTLMEAIGAPRYEVEEIAGFAMPGVGWEESTRYLYKEFLLEPQAQRSVLARPAWFLYHGTVEDFSLIERLILQLRGQEGVLGTDALIVVANKFSERALIDMAANFRAGALKVFPLVAPLTSFHGSQQAFLGDLAAVTGATIYDPFTNGIEHATFAGLGLRAQTEDTETGPTLVYRSATQSVEVGRKRSTVFGHASEDAILFRVEELRYAQQAGVSQLEHTLLQERIARLSGGIARLTIWDTAPSAVQERKDRADDAVCAVRGALKAGVLFGGCWGLQRIRMQVLAGDASPAAIVLMAALRRPLERLLENVGIVNQEANEIISEVGFNDCVFDALNLTLVSASEAGIYDSASAVMEALRNSLSIATLVGTMGGAVVSARDVARERQEARDEAELARQLKEQGEDQ